jgi:hypothetical protein
MFKYLPLKFVVFFHIASLLQWLSGEFVGFFIFIIEFEFGKLLGALVGNLLLFSSLAMIICIFITSIWLVIPDYRKEYSFKELLNLMITFKGEKIGFLDGLSGTFNYIKEREKHGGLIVIVIIILFYSVNLPFVSNFKTYEISDTFIQKNSQLYHDFEDTYVFKPYSIVVERHSFAFLLLKNGYINSEDNESSKYYFMKEAAIIHGYRFLECYEHGECFMDDDIYSLGKWIKTYLISLIDNILRALFYGIIPYYLGILYINRDKLNEIFKSFKN